MVLGGCTLCEFARVLRKQTEFFFAKGLVRNGEGNMYPDNSSGYGCSCSIVEEGLYGGYTLGDSRGVSWEAGCPVGSIGTEVGILLGL